MDAPSSFCCLEHAETLMEKLISVELMNDGLVWMRLTEISHRYLGYLLESCVSLAGRGTEGAWEGAGNVG